MQPIHRLFPDTSAQPATNWRYASTAPASSTPAQRCLPARTTNWRYGTFADCAARPIVSSISTKPFAVNWRYQISVG